MAKVKYAVINGDDVLGIMWETDKKDVFVVMGEWDVNHSLEIRSPDNGKLIDDKDSIELLMEILPR